MTDFIIVDQDGDVVKKIRSQIEPQIPSDYIESHTLKEVDDVNDHNLDSTVPWE